ncbi:uncharacterized protein [Solanum tuberosum]|uniref:uncharacterized protein n=1 Tax=Solanum tuberosum TaxID=4113 RepID=UPI00073A509C|nr:PREDICTED: uncharacterized protein LOC107059696 [Solanum tuberosum]
MEPFQDPLELDQYKRKLGFDNALANYSEKIWIFWRDDWEGTLLMDSIQHISMKFCKNNSSFIISSIYARCNALDRLELWEELEGIAEYWRIPWMVGGYFNVVIDEEEKLGGLEFTQQEAIDFALWSKYTWWNGRIDEACIFKRLDRILVNALFTEEFSSSETKHHKFKEVVQQHWRIEFAGSPFLEVHAKLKRVKRALAKWSRDVFGNIFQQIATVEDLIKVKETQLEILPTVENRAELSRMETKLRKYLKIEKEYWK